MMQRLGGIAASFFCITSMMSGCTSLDRHSDCRHGNRSDAVGTCEHAGQVIYVGTHADPGLHVLAFEDFDRSTSEVQTLSERTRQNFQALHPDGSYLYSVSSDHFSDDADHGTVRAYAIDRRTGLLVLINERSTGGRGPAHVSVDPHGRFVYVSNFGGGNLSVYSIRDDGGLSEAVDMVQHEGSSIDERRQTGPHVHSAIPSFDGRFIYVSDMGTDKIMIYAVDEASGELAPAVQPYVTSTPGAGPRHFTIHPDGRTAYSLEQISSTISVFRVDRLTGALTRIQRASMLPDEFDADNQAADVHISPDGNFLYASNRGHDSIAIYRINRASGKLSVVGFEPTRGAHPRNFMIDREGGFILVANRDDDEVVLFRRDRATGRLSYAGERAQVPRPVCLTQHFLR